MTMLQDAPTRVRPTYGYYRQPNGWITASPATDTDELQYRRSGWEPLRQYGNFEMTTPYSINHPLEALFMRGGAHELPEDQIRQMGFALNVPMVPACKTPLSQEHKRHAASCLSNAKPVVFPQLQHMTDLGPFPCKICADRVFPTDEAREQHTLVMHAPEKSDERTGQALSEALIKGLGGKVAVPVSVEEPATVAPVLDLVAAMRTEIEALRQELAASKSAKPQQQAKRRHTHKAPYGPGHLVAGCPVCEEMRPKG